MVKNVAFIYLLNVRIRWNCFSNTNSGLGQAAITEARLVSQTPMLWISDIDCFLQVALLL